MKSGEMFTTAHPDVRAHNEAYYENTFETPQNMRSICEVERLTP